jgi:hypothetical protein
MAEKWRQENGGGIAFPIAGTADPFSVEDTGLGRGLTTEYSEYAEMGLNWREPRINTDGHGFENVRGMIVRGIKAF